jgi:putative ABC transport system substrate-binding protein
MKIPRRDFIVGATAAAASPIYGVAQDRKKYLLGLLSAVSPEAAAPQSQAISDGLRDLGYVDGRDYQLVAKWAYGRIEKLPELANELLQLKPDVLMGNPIPAVVALRALTTSIPIVSFMLADEVHLGLVESDARPGGNVTGLSMRVDGMVGKQMQLATQTISGAAKMGILINPTSADAATQRREAEAAARELVLTPVYADARSRDEISSAFLFFQREHVNIVVCLYDALFFERRKQIADLALDNHLPVVCGARDHVVAGGLISYGISLRDNARRLGSYIAKILQGEKPGDLPVEFPTRLELVLNLNTAKALGLELPDRLLVAADEVIE